MSKLPLLKAKIITIFPEIFPSSLGVSLAGSALKNNIWSLDVINLRDFGKTKHKIVDDEPFGGGNGMVMKPDVISDAIEFAKIGFDDPEILYPSPRGEVFNQATAYEFARKKEIIFICGRFEGIDERVIEEYNIRQISIGDFVLSGGELAAITILDATIRLLPGVLANQDTLLEESFSFNYSSGNLLEYPQYTRPAVWHGREVPEVLRSGNHKLIKEWRLEKSLEITKKIRPDLLKNKADD